MRRNTISLSGPRLQPAGRYRFWNNTRPPEQRDPIRAQVTTTDDGAGTATIRIYDPIDSYGEFWGVSASEVADALNLLDDSVTDIALRLNSPGGEVWEAVAILNLLRQHPATVTAYVDGWAASAASLLACGSDEVVMGRNTQLMIHDASGFCWGQASDMRAYADLLDKVSDEAAGIYQAKAGEDVAFWRTAMLAESWYSAQEAVDAGLADRVEGAAPDDADAPEDRFDTSLFKHSNRADAPAPPLPSAVRPAPTGPSAMQQRRHSMAGHRHRMPL